MLKRRHNLLAATLIIVVSQVGFAETMIPVGVAKVDITPKHPVVLAGYGGRTGEHQGIDTKLWARALVIGKSSPVAIVVIDNCGFTKQIVGKLSQRLAPHNIVRSRLVVAATHTHNAPSLAGYAPVVWAGRLSALQQQHMEQYTKFVVEKMAAAIIEAKKTAAPMKLEWARGRVHFGGNRRVIHRGRWAGFGFRRSGLVDHSLPVLAARDAAGKVKAVWVNYACHCTTVGSGNRVSGDWAGYSNAWLEKLFPGATALTTIGCGADVGPQPSGNLAIAQQHGKAIAQETQRVLEGKTMPITTLPISTQRHVKLKFAKPGSKEYWQGQLKRGGFHGQQAKILLAKLQKDGRIPDHITYPISVWQFGQELSMIFLGGEVVVDYAVLLNLALDWRRTWITGWSNAMPGYIPSARVLREGGYETDFSQVYYAQPGRYSPQIESTIIDGVKRIIGRSYWAKKGQPVPDFHATPSQEPAVYKRVSQWVDGVRSNDERLLLAKLRKWIGTARVGYWKMKRNEGEQTEWYNFAGDFSKRNFIRQTKKGTTLQWQVFNVPKQGPVTLCFLGGVGWNSQPKTAGFEMKLGRHRIRFDVVLKSTRWQSADRQLELVYLPTWISDVDSAGFFFLHIPSRQSLIGWDETIRVRSLGQGSQRWFAIDADQKVLPRKKKLAAALQAK